MAETVRESHSGREREEGRDCQWHLGKERMRLYSTVSDHWAAYQLWTYYACRTWCDWRLRKINLKLSGSSSGWKR